ncbi:hypothetical protein AMS68_003633 [Peltaster fructicola]|uniref:Uncharacterized protein n=1 Tax=Peltaster fructicola TaxID=286661 RepID=A0A6H0XTW5_9PEZI|nr:hypothetical protein AMS68_003633 [Peltaster fructicola]
MRLSFIRTELLPRTLHLNTPTATTRTGAEDCSRPLCRVQLLRNEMLTICGKEVMQAPTETESNISILTNHYNPLPLRVGTSSELNK